MSEEAIVTIAVRLIAPLLILRLPLIGTLLAAYIDAADYQYIGGYEWYQPVDKILDTYYLAFSAYMALRWRDTTARTIAIVAFLWRFIGIVLFLILGWQELLFIFANFFELFFIFYLLVARLSGHTKVFVSRRITSLLMVALLLPKLFQEYMLHVYLPNMQYAPELIVRMFDASITLPITIAHIPAIIVLIWLIIKMRRSQYGQILPRVS